MFMTTDEYEEHLWLQNLILDHDPDFYAISKYTETKNTELLLPIFYKNNIIHKISKYYPNIIKEKNVKELSILLFNALKDYIATKKPYTGLLEDPHYCLEIDGNEYYVVYEDARHTVLLKINNIDLTPVANIITHKYLV